MILKRIRAWLAGRPPEWDWMGVQCQTWYRCRNCNKLKKKENIMFISENGEASCSGCRGCNDHYTADPTIVVHIRC